MGCRCSAATTPSSPPTRACARRTRRSRWPRGWRSRAFYGQCRRVLSPSAASDAVLRDDGHRRRADRPLGPRRRPRALLARAARAGPAAGRDHRALRGPPDPREGRRPARRRVPAPRASATRACTSCSPAAGPRRTCCASASASTRRSSAGSRATSSRAAYASADIFLFASRTDTFGQVLLEAQASGLPVVAVAEGGPTSIVTDGVTGRLCARRRGRARRRRRRARGPATAARAARAQTALEAVARAHLGALAAASRRRLPPGAGSRRRVAGARRAA